VQNPPGVPMGRRPKLQGQEAEIIAAYAAGASTIELGERYGVTKKVIGRIVSGAGILRQPHKPKATTPEQDAEMVERYRSDPNRWTMTALADEYGCGRRTVGRILRAAGVEVDSKPGPRGRGRVAAPNRAVR
jgi:transposase